MSGYSVWVFIPIGAHPCRVIDRAWEPRITSPCSLKAITNAIGSKIESSWSRWNRCTEYDPVGMKTHIEYPDIFFKKYYSPYHIEMGTYILINLLWAGGSVAPTQPTSLRWNWGNFAQTCSICLEGPYRKRFIWRSSLLGDRQGLRAPNTFPVQFKDYNSCNRIQNWGFSVPLE